MSKHPLPAVVEVPAIEATEAGSELAETGLRYLGVLCAREEAEHWLADCLAHIDWGPAWYEAFGRRFELPRQQAWFADAGIRYRYSDNLLETRPWPDNLENLKRRVEQLSGHSFNSVLATLYRSGQDSVSWHADDEAELGPEPIIASVSFGADRQFWLRRKNNPAIDRVVTLRAGECWLMDACCQRDWQHQVPEQPEVMEPRVNLTFRWVVPPESIA